MEHLKTLNHPARIWTFDGGGPGVISQLLIVNEIMLQIQWIFKLADVPRPYQYADLMVGTGLGAIVVVLLARLRLTAEEALGHLIKLGQDVFTAPTESTNVHRFDVKILATAMKSILGERGLDEHTKLIEDVVTGGQAYAQVSLLSPSPSKLSSDLVSHSSNYSSLTAVPTSNLSTCRMLRTYRGPGTDSDLTILDAILGSVAHPDWFPSVMIGSTYCKEELISGSIRFNNPTKKALEEATRVFGSEHQVSVMISLGSGQQPARFLAKQTAEGLQEALNAMAQEGDSVTDDLAQRFSGSSFYYRFSVDLGVEPASTTEWSQSTLGTIIGHTKTYMEQISSSLATATKMLIENKGSHTLEQLTRVKTESATAKSVPELSPYYVVRDNVYDSMDWRLVRGPEQGRRLFVINGMGGAGKTQLASFFARRNRERYKYVFFIDASSVESIKAGLQSASRSLGGTHSQDTFEDTLRFLTQTGNHDWLVIFDNADDPNLSLATYLPKCEHGTIIITGRNHNLIQLAPTSYLHLQGMDEFHSTQVLLNAAQRNIAGNEEESKSVTELCRSLGGLPLALVQVGCYCHTTQISFSQYLERFKTHRSKLMEMKPPPQLDEYSYSTYTSINLSYSLLGGRAQSLLHLLAFFHPSNIHLAIFEVAAKYNFLEEPAGSFLARDQEYNERLNVLRQLVTPNGSWENIEIDNLLRQLQEFSLIFLSHSNGQTNVTLHPLVQSCILDTLSSNDHRLYFYMAVIALGCCGRRDEIVLFQHLPAHIAEMESRNVNIHPNDVVRFAYIMHWIGDYEKAMKRLENVRDQCGLAKGAEHRSTLILSYWIGYCLSQLGKYEESEKMIREVIEMQERVLGAEDDHTLKSYELLARIFNEQSKIEEAQNILMRLLRLYESKYGQEHRQTLRTQSLLAKNLSIQERYSEAETLLRNVLPPMKELGEDDDITLATLNALSVVLSHQSKFAEAEVILNVLVTNCTRKHGKEHLDTLLNRTNLATCLFRQGNLARAEEILREVLELQQRIVRKNHPHSIDARNWLEYVIQAQAQAQAQVLSTNGLPTNLRNPSIPTNPELLSDGRPLKPQRKSVRLERIRQAASRASPKPSRRSKKSRNNRKSVYRKLPRFRTPDLYSHQMIVYRLIKV